MRKSLKLLSCLALMAGAALVHAQTPTVEPAAPLKCRPSLVGGDGQNFRMLSDGTHAVFLWGCRTLTNEWKPEGFIWQYGYTLKLPSLSTYLKSGDLFDALWQANVKPASATTWPQSVTDMEVRLWTDIKPTLPAVPVYVVAPNSTYPTRPVKILVDGKPADPAVKNLTVPVGTVCEMARGAFASGSYVYGAVPTSAVANAAAVTETLYAVCRPKS